MMVTIYKKRRARAMGIPKIVMARMTTRTGTDIRATAPVKPVENGVAFI